VDQRSHMWQVWAGVTVQPPPVVRVSPSRDFGHIIVGNQSFGELKVTNVGLRVLADVSVRLDALNVPLSVFNGNAAGTDGTWVLDVFDQQQGTIARLQRQGRRCEHRSDRRCDSV
jgi:hypothetical protein